MSKKTKQKDKKIAADMPKEEQKQDKMTENKQSEEEKTTKQTEPENALPAEDQQQKDEQKEAPKSPAEEWEEKYNQMNDKYLRLSAEFDNYRKRTLKERMDLLKTASEDVLLKILPVVDNFERALKSMENAQDIEAVKQGVDLIYTNFVEFLEQRGVKEIPALEQEFDTDKHEAVTKIPAPDKKLKGKVVDIVEKGYYLNDKVIRYAKVVIGE